MKSHKLNPLRLAIASLVAVPSIAMAVPPTGTPYYTDTTNSYVQDQTSQVMGQLNSILCFMGAMGPDQMVNLSTNNGNYIALIDKNTCDAKGSGGQSGSTGPAYVPAVVNSSRASNTADMVVKAWLEFPENNNQKISIYATASQAPSTTLPYGVFRMDYCGETTDCTIDKGYINATTSGLSFYSGGTYSAQNYSTALQLNASSSTAGSGIANDINPWNGDSTFYFAYNTGNFVRSNGTTSQCFDRDPANADESVWRYGLYDPISGARITRNSGFPFEYTVGGVTSNGYIGYYGMWTQGTGPASGDTVNKVTYSQSGATKTPYTLLKTGGKLMKFTTATKTLAALNKVTFWYYAQNNVGAEMTAGSQYELFWDDTAKQFYVSGKQNSGTYNMEPTTPVAVANSAMVAANPYGIFGWSQMLGGQFGIKGNDFANLTGGTPSTIPVVTQTQDVVYPSQYAAIGSLTCINDCPTAALIGTSNGGTGTAYSNQGWTPVASAAFVSYSLNGTTGNLIDAAPADVVSNATSGTNANGVRSGRLVTTTDAATIISRKNAACSNCDSFNQGDVDLLDVGSSYYVWETGGQPWNQLAILMDGVTPVTFDAPLPVSFVVPANTDLVNKKPYGDFAGATISLQYGGFGDLWGIPNECIDVATNESCVFSGGTPTPQNQQRWTSKFSIPYDSSSGAVTANAGATTYYVKPLDKEIRLAKVPLLTCSNAGLTAPAPGSVTLPVVSNWSDPTVSNKTGTTKPAFATVPAPQIIHGVKQY